MGYEVHSSSGSTLRLRGAGAGASAQRSEPPNDQFSLTQLAGMTAAAGLDYWTEEKLAALLMVFEVDAHNSIKHSVIEGAAAHLEDLLQTIKPAKQHKQHTHDETALPPKLREFEPLAKMASVAGALSPLKDCDAALERSPDDSAERHASVEALHKELEKAKPVLKAAITERLASPGLVQTCGEVIDVGLDFFQGSYDEIFSTIKKSEGIEAYVKPTKALTDAAARGHEKLTKWLQQTHAAPPSAMQRTGAIPNLMADACSEPVCTGFDAVLKAVQTAVPRAMSNAEGAQLQSGPVKRSSRILEKVMLREDDEGNADRVCDVRRALIVVPSMADFGAVLNKFVDLADDAAGDATIVVVRVKDRIESPAAGWRDVMINFYLTADPNRHVCEVQVAHLKMLTARAGLDGHAVYGRVRNASEQLEKAGVEPEGAQSLISRVLKKGRSLEQAHIDLNNCGLDGSIARALAHVLKTNDNLLTVKYAA